MISDDFSIPDNIYLEISDEIALFLKKYEKMFDAPVPTQWKTEIPMNQLMYYIREYRKKDPTISECDLLGRQSITRREPQARSAALDEFENIRRSVEEKRYQRMIGRKPRVQDPLSGSVQSLSMGISIISGLFLMFFVGFFAAYYTGYRDMTTRLFCGLATSVGYIFLEATLIMLYDYKLNSRSKKQHRK